MCPRHAEAPSLSKSCLEISPPDHQGSATLQWSTPFLCLLLCHLLLLDDLAARRAGAVVLPCALGTPPSLADVSPSRARALSAWHEEAALGWAVVAGDYDRSPTSIRSFTSFPTGCHKRVQDATH